VYTKTGNRLTNLSQNVILLQNGILLASTNDRVLANAEIYCKRPRVLIFYTNYRV